MAVTKKSVIESMEKLGVYKTEFDPAIERYVKLQKEYTTLYAKYAKDGYPCEVETPSGVKKAPIVATLEALRRDILKAENELGLTPTGLLKIQENAFKKAKTSRKDALI